jgi:hypothetical protein
VWMLFDAGYRSTAVLSGVCWYRIVGSMDLMDSLDANTEDEPCNPIEVVPGGPRRKLSEAEKQLVREFRWGSAGKGGRFRT